MASVYPLAKGDTGHRSLTTIDEAFAQIAGLATAVEGIELRTPASSIGRVAACDVVTEAPLPRFDHAAMDGFGLCALDLVRAAPFDLNVSGRVFAGSVGIDAIQKGHAVRLLTGAPIPGNVEAVVPEESCIVSADQVRVLKAVSEGANIRRRGEDVPSGAVIVRRDERLDARHLAILAASGIRELQTRRRVRVALLSVGDELVPAGEDLRPGGINDVNGPMLQALLEASSVEVTDLGIQRDNLNELAEVLRNAAARVDVVVSSGGVSGSDADHVAAAIADAGGTARTLKLALKPGKPLLVGRIGSVPVIGLPGNPVAALVNFMLFARPLLSLRAGTTASRPRGYLAYAAEPMVHRVGRTEFVPARIVDRTKDGRARVTLMRPYGAARLNPLVLSDGFVEIGMERGDVAAEEPIAFHAFRTEFSI